MKFETPDDLLIFKMDIMMIYSFLKLTLVVHFLLKQLIYNVVLISVVQQSDSVICVCIFILFQIFSHIGYNIIVSKVPSAIGPCWLSILYIVVYVY